MTYEAFVNTVGFLLGILIILYTVFVSSAPLKYIAKFAANSVLGCIVLIISNYFLANRGINVGINPITAVAVGILGFPGAVAVVLLAVIVR